MEYAKKFIFGAQYYRPPTPHRSCWDRDLKNAKLLGLNSIRFWVLWRWVHRDENYFYFDDIDEMMSLAEKYGLKVTLGIICDVIPKWIYDKYPDSVMVLPNGERVEPYALGFRQIGGFPGPCYNHAEATEQRKNFIDALVNRYKDHSALDMWDVWCEPEQCGKFRKPDTKTLVCYCKSCRAKFEKWLENKYQTIDKLNEVWGRCYRDFHDIELPVNSGVFADFIDFRNFHLDKMTNEAKMRIASVKKADNKHSVYLHVVPNTSSIFNALTCVDDFRLADECDIFGSTNFANPIWSIMTLSAGRDKLCINAECHIGNGTVKMHQKIINYEDMLKDLVPQIGMGIRGFVFWQFKPETCGSEAPAWGMTKLNGEPGSVALAASRFIKALKPYEKEIMEAKKPKSEIAIWKGRNNEIFAYIQQGNLTPFAETIENYVNAFYYNNYECAVVDDKAIIDGLEDIKFLILPYCYAMDATLAKAVDNFVRNGGTVLCEAHLGGYDIDRGRHSYVMPGCGLNELWGIEEKYTTASYHLKTDISDLTDEFLSDDAKKAAQAYGLTGGKYYPIKYGNKVIICAERFAALEAENAEIICTFNDESVIIKKAIGKGNVYYCGSNFGEGASADRDGFESFLKDILSSIDIEPTLTFTERGIHIDKISDDMIMINNTSDKEQKINIDGRYISVFHSDLSFEDKIVIPPESADIYVKQ